MERVGRVELRDLQLGRLLDAPCPVYPRINILMHIYNAITNSGLHIHLSMMNEESFYILVYDFLNYDVRMKFFNNCNTAKEFIQALK